MREEYQEILEDAVMDSMSGEDFDEMLLRAAKKHLPLKYNKHFSAMLEEILAEAGDRGITNRQAAQALLRNLKSPQARAPRPVTLPEPLPAPPSPAPSRPSKVPELLPVVTRPAGSLARPPAPPSRPEKTQATNGPPPAEAPEDGQEVVEVPKILDLAGAHPESLPPDVKDKLKKLVKVQKRKSEWSEVPDEGPDPTMFFKGSQRVPPVVRPKEPEPDENAGAGDEPQTTDAPAPLKKRLKQLKKD